MKKLIRSTIDLSSIPEDHKNGDCFKVAYDTMMEHQNYTLVHGIVTGQGAIAGIQYCHAWCEEGDVVVDNTICKRIDKDLYYAIGNIEIVRKYNFREMLENAIDTGTYGPWDSVFDNYY